MDQHRKKNVADSADSQQESQRRVKIKFGMARHTIKEWKSKLFGFRYNQLVVEGNESDMVVCNIEKCKAVLSKKRTNGLRRMPEENQSNEILLLRNEVERYKSLYEQEREQFMEFQGYSKELETELDIELTSLKKKVSELDGSNRRAVNELENYKSRYEKERKEFIATENQLRTKLNTSEENCKETKQKLRRVEQLNDDLERRERIQAQELLDWANRYEKCLERCAYLEAGVLNGQPEEAESNGSILSSEVLADRTNLFQPMIMNSSPLNSPTSTNHKSIDGELSTVSNSNHQAETPRNGFHGFGSSLKKNFLAFSTPHSKERPSSAIVSSLFRKIEEVEKQVDPKKYIIHRTPNRK